MRRSWGVAAGRGIGAVGGALVCLSALHALGGCSDLLGMEASRVRTDGAPSETSYDDTRLSDGPGREAHANTPDGTLADGTRFVEGGPGTTNADANGSADSSIVDGPRMDAPHNAPDTPPATESPKLDEAKLRSDAVREAIGANALSALKGIVSTFIDKGTEVQFTADDVVNSSSIHLHAMESAGETCRVPFTGKVNPPEYSYAFPNCTVRNGTTIGGTLVFSVIQTTDADSGPPSLHVTFTFKTLKVSGATLDGTTVVSTTDLVNFPLDANLTIASLGSLTFQGSGTTTSAAGGVVASMTGSGTIAKNSGAILDGGTDASLPGLDPGTDGWTCTPKDAGSYHVTELSRTLKDCYPHSGTMDVLRAFTCTKGALTRDVATQTTLTFGEDSRTSGLVTAQVHTTIDATETAGEAINYPLPWICSPPDSTDAGARTP